MTHGNSEIREEHKTVTTEKHIYWRLGACADCGADVQKEITAHQAALLQCGWDGENIADLSALQHLREWVPLCSSCGHARDAESARQWQESLDKHHAELIEEYKYLLGAAILDLRFPEDGDWEEIGSLIVRGTDGATYELTADKYSWNDYGWLEVRKQ